MFNAEILAQSSADFALTIMYNFHGTHILGHRVVIFAIAQFSCSSADCRTVDDYTVKASNYNSDTVCLMLLLLALIVRCKCTYTADARLKLWRPLHTEKNGDPLHILKSTFTLK